ncbi:DEAD/DEAH box helicase family protein [Leptolyngbya sp. BC1307]|uniref:type I restriction endonuclease subunit R n=1 Tax=Leptolyngbya sp. BC1307 TaxID=2029589 RepID=UPI000EFB49FD|nr:DEAD/DEAH box helicase family protein [Leptolyngbya sp. BC1307]
MAVNQNPEQIARDRIDTQLRAAGWVVQAKSGTNLSAAQGVAIREYQTDVGPADYVLFVDRKAVGVIEAKKESEGHRLTTHETQTAGYAAAKLKWINNREPLPFLYESTGMVTQFTDGREPKPQSREIFHFHRPEELAKRLTQEPLRSRLQHLNPLNPEGLPAAALGLRDCQAQAIKNLEDSLKAGKTRSLIQMATGAGKTFTAITSMHRLLKPPVKAKRILFLVDTLNLGKQAEQEMMAYLPSDDSRQFSDLYVVQRPTSPHIAQSAQVVVCTIQRLYSILKGEALSEDDEATPAETYIRRREPLPVVYNERITPDFFDFIYIDECHRSIYNLWQQVLDYFDAFLIGLTATPDSRTFGFFDKNVVSEYSHERAVGDGVNVGNEVYRIDTRITQSGDRILQGQSVQKREKLTRRKRWELSDEEQVYAGQQLDRSVVNPDQIRTLVREFKAQLPALFPGRTEVPKTLIFAKTDSHADDIIRMVRTEFGESNEFCKKVTYKAKQDTVSEAGEVVEAGSDPDRVLANFRNDYYPRVAVTVNMIATGTDVKPLECLLFMRDVKSRNYFEQMKGRGTRTLGEDDLKKVTPSARSAKTHYVIVDAVGVTRSLKTPSQPLITQPSVPFRDLAMGVMMGDGDAEMVSSLAGRLARLDRQLTPEQQQQVSEQNNGMPLRALVGQLLSVIDPDQVEARARESLPAGAGEPDEAALEAAQLDLCQAAGSLLTGDLITLLEGIRRDREQTIDHDNLDEVLASDWAGNSEENAQALVQKLEDYLRENQDEIEALSIYFQQPQRRREVTFEMVSAVLAKLRADRPNLAPLRVWQAYQLLENGSGNPMSELTALVGLIRRVAGVDGQLMDYETVVRRNFQNWVMRAHAGGGDKFDAPQMDWLHMIRDHVMSSFHFEREDLEMSPFDGQGGLGKMYELFGDRMDDLIEELNGALVA